MLLEELDRVLKAVVGGLALLGVGGVATDREPVTSVVFDELESLVILEDLGRLFLLLLVELCREYQPQRIVAEKQGALTITSAEALLKRKGTDFLLRASMSAGTSRREG